ncbi:MAG: hypothetical protein GC171_12780 [Terrimonas sp.]|nr:hypothetical protein [Terrimonas sp.]
MKKCTVFVFLWVMAIQGWGQRNYFIYLQTDNQQPFYVKMDEKIYSSAISGYLVLANLGDSTHQFSIGFPGRESLVSFYVTMNHKDHGYLIKDFGEKGWGLFDLQTLGIQFASKARLMTDDILVKTEKKEPNAFTELLSLAANDSTLNQKTTILEPVTEMDHDATASLGKTALVLKDTLVNNLTDSNRILTKNPDAGLVEKTLPAVKDTLATTDAIVKAKDEQEEKKPGNDSPLSGKGTPQDINTAQTAKPDSQAIKTAILQEELNKVVEPAYQEKTALLKTDSIQAKKDTVATALKNIVKETNNEQKPGKEAISSRVIPETESGSSETAYRASVVTKRMEITTTEGLSLVFEDEYPDGHRDTIRVIISMPKTATAAALEIIPEKKETEPPLRFLEIIPDTSRQDRGVAKLQPGNNCKELASNDDFFQVRRDMAAVIDEYDMLAQAEKVFRVKCFSTDQVKNLGSLFLSDKGKYQFFKASYPHVSDPASFPSLEKEITDDYYIRLFRALLKEKTKP